MSTLYLAMLEIICIIPLWDGVKISKPLKPARGYKYHREGK